MGRIGLVAAILALLLLGAAGTLGAEVKKPGPPVSHELSVAILDMARAFKECRYYDEKMAALHAEIDAEDQILKRRAAELQRRSESKDDDFDQSSAQKERDELQALVVAQRRHRLRSEAAIYRTVYQELLRQLEGYCGKKGIVLVLKVGGSLKEREPFCHVPLSYPEKICWHGNEITGEMVERVNASLAEK